MKKLFLLLSLVVVLPLAWCSLPLTEVATIVLKIKDAQGQPLSGPVTAFILDADGQTVLEKTSNLLLDYTWVDFWAHSTHGTSPVAPERLYTAAAVKITGAGCKPVTIPLEFIKEYMSLSFSPHGSGSAYMYYHMDKDLVMECTPSEAGAQ